MYIQKNKIGVENEKFIQFPFHNSIKLILFHKNQQNNNNRKLLCKT